MPIQNNLFSVDQSEIERLLKEANSGWLQQCESLVNDSKLVPDQIKTSKDFSLAQELVKKLNTAVKRTRSERLSDQKQFSQAIKTVKSFYDNMEKSLKRSLDTLLRRLTTAAQVAQNETSIEEEIESSKIVVDNAGNVIGTGTSMPTNLGSDIKLLWSVKSVDRSTVDLEILRDHFTEKALLLACQKLLTEQGPINIPGIEYERIAKPI